MSIRTLLTQQSQIRFVRTLIFSDVEHGLLGWKLSPIPSIVARKVLNFEGVGKITYHS